MPLGPRGRHAQFEQADQPAPFDEPPEPTGPDPANPDEVTEGQGRTGRRGGGRAQRRKAAQRAKRRRRMRTSREVPILVLTALLMALLLKTFLVQAFSIPSGSMENTIQIGDRVVVDKLTPWFGSKPSRGDVVVFKDPGGWLTGQPPAEPSPFGIKQVKSFFTFIGLLPSNDEQDLIKRVVAVGGDTVACCDNQGRVTVNGHPLDEPYLHPGNPPSMIRFSVRVPRGRLFMMGDHRSRSADSRFHLNDAQHGTVPEDLVVGRAFAVAWPLGHWDGLGEPDTFGSVAERGEKTAGLDTTNNPLGANVPPVPVELPLVVSVVGILPKRAAARFGRRARGPGAGPEAM